MDLDITDHDFDELRGIIRREAGIALGDAKRHLLVARLARRVRHLGLSSFGDYCRYLASLDPRGEERLRMVNCITTNKTDFFREAHHFAFLRERVVPEALDRARGRRPRVRVWSAACSTGEEPYSIAITLRQALGPDAVDGVRVLATDIDTDVLRHAERGIYGKDRITAIPHHVLRECFLRGRGEWANHVLVRPELRRLVTFARLNLIDEPWPIRTRFDVIFCRNALIYFDPPTQRSICRRFARYLDPHGYLLVGHSESLLSLHDLYAPVRGTIYALRAGQSDPAPHH
jgi:chemotaxis protein methyltransferase CheR